jgi:pimeloyl-ACP methyl ester carboxylesterase
MPDYRGSDDAALSYDDTRPAGGVPVIALAGGAGLHPDYLGDLAGVDARLVIPHLRGVGRSPLPDDVRRASFWRQAEDLERLRVHLGLETVVLLGHSAGTRLALAYAARFPERVAALVLVTPPVGYATGPLVDVPSDADVLIGKRRGDPVFDAALAAREAGPDGLDDFPAWTRRTAPVSYATWGETQQAHAAACRYDLAANRAWFSVDEPAGFAGLLAAVTAPVLVVAGGEDYGLGVAPVVAVAELFPAGRAVVIDGSAHTPWVEQPEAFRAAVNRFLSSSGVL